MIKIENKKNCCGCTACMQACINGCISMEHDDEGFVYPVVNEHSCVECGLCDRVCPVKNHKEFETNNQGFIARSMLNNRINSSSGGVFYLLAQTILQEGGVVCGAVYNEKNLVNHVIIDNVKSIAPLLGSKYIQSDLDGIFVKIKEYLKNGRKVLFSGTACQVAGLKGFLIKEYDNLFTIDVLCHGVPSPGVWLKYVQYIENKEKKILEHVNFRDKTTGWHDYSILHKFDDGDYFREYASENSFMKLFLSDYILRPSCYDCKFKNISRISDITIGDAWGIEKWKPELDDNNGTSVIIVHSKKGKEFLEMSRTNLEIIPCKIDKMLPPDAASRKSPFMPRGRALFFHRFKKKRSYQNMVAATKPTFINKVLRRIVVNKKN